MANNTGLIIGVSVVGVAVVGIGIYLVTKKPTATVAPVVGSSINPATGYPYGYTNTGVKVTTPTNPTYVAGQPAASQDSWWQNPLGQVGGNLANKLIDSLFAPKAAASSTVVDTTMASNVVDPYATYDPYASTAIDYGNGYV